MRFGAVICRLVPGTILRVSFHTVIWFWELIEDFVVVIVDEIVLLYKMAEKEDNVYKAKLAEQAERYDGMIKCGIMLSSSGSFDRHVDWLAY